MSEGMQSIHELIDRIYSVVVTPDEFDALMDAWLAYMEEAVSTGGGLEDKPDATPILVHLDRALALLLNSQIGALPDNRPQTVVKRFVLPAAIVDEHANLIAANEAFARTNRPNLDNLTELADTDRDRELIKRRCFEALHIDADNIDNAVTVFDESANLKAMSFQSLPNLTTNEERHVLVRVSGPAWSEEIGKLLQREFGLSAAEMEIVRGFADGLSLKEIAEKRDRSEQTIRGQLKSIFSRLQISSQTELVRLISNLAFIFDKEAPQATAGDKHFDQTPVSGHINLSDGNKVDYTLRGAEGGTPFLFLHGMALGHEFHSDFVRALVEENLTAVCLDRPGYRGSPPSETDKSQNAYFARALPEVLDHFSINRGLIVTNTSGVFPACLAAAENPDRVKAILPTAAGVPMTSWRMFMKLPKRIKTVALTCRYGAAAVPYIMAAGYARSTKDEAEDLVLKAYGDVSVDREALRDPEILNLVKPGWRSLSYEKLQGYLSDAKDIFSDWTDVIAAVQCPVHYYQGSEDEICRAEWSEDLANRFPHVSSHEIKGAGQLVFHTHWPEILNGIRHLINH